MKTLLNVRPTLPHLGERRFRHDPVAVDALLDEARASFAPGLLLALAALGVAGALLALLG